MGRPAKKATPTPASAAVVEPTGTVTLIPISHFSLAINGTIVSFHHGKPFDADAAMQAALSAANAPVAPHE